MLQCCSPCLIGLPTACAQFASMFVAVGALLQAARRPELNGTFFFFPKNIQQVYHSCFTKDYLTLTIWSQYKGSGTRQTWFHSCRSAVRSGKPFLYLSPVSSPAAACLLVPLQSPGLYLLMFTHMHSFQSDEVKQKDSLPSVEIVWTQRRFPLRPRQWP